MCWKIDFICNTNSFSKVHQSSQILTRSVKRGQSCTKNKTHGYEFYHKNLRKTRRHGAGYDAGMPIAAEKITILDGISKD